MPAIGNVNLVLFGAPGSGKGTQSAFLIERYGIPQISTGHILRAQRQAGNPLADRVRGYMARATPKEKKRLKSTHDPKSTRFLPKERWAAVYRALPAPIDLAFALAAMSSHLRVSSELSPRRQ